jgi:uncharacterized protein (DUF1330 family)
LPAPPTGDRKGRPYELLEAFVSDPEYQPLKALRKRVAKADIVVVQGL